MKLYGSPSFLEIRLSTSPQYPQLRRNPSLPNNPPWAPTLSCPSPSNFLTPQITNIFANSGITAASFGAVAGIFALFFFDEVPKVRRDIMQKLPVVGDYFVREVPPEDNVSSFDGCQYYLGR
jgi:hypothetical protein